MKDGQEMAANANQENYKPKYFRVEILDNGVPIFCQNGYDQITLSHFNFRCNNGLSDAAEEEG